MEKRRHYEKKPLAEWMRDPDIMKEVAARSGGKIKFRYAILPAETRAEAEALRAALERETGCPGIVDEIHRFDDMPPRLEDHVPCPYALSVASETLAKHSPELLDRVRSQVPHPCFPRLTRAGECVFSWCCGLLADLLELLLHLVRRLKGKTEKSARPNHQPPC